MVKASAESPMRTELTYGGCLVRKNTTESLSLKDYVSMHRKPPFQSTSGLTWSHDHQGQGCFYRKTECQSHGPKNFKNTFSKCRLYMLKKATFSYCIKIYN